MLDRLGYRVTAARNGAEAVAACDGVSFDLLLAEAVMSLLATRDGALLSRVEMRPLRPPKRA